VAEHKTVTGSNAEFAATTAHACLNRGLGAAPWDVQQLNARRLAWHPHDPQRRDSARGIIPLDHTLVDHAGQLSEDAGYDWDHAAKRQKIAHDYRIAHDVCPSGKHDALEFRRVRKREDCAAKAAEWQAREGGLEAASEDDRRRATCQSHTLRCGELVDGVVAHQMPGTCTLDRYFTNAPVLNHMDQQARSDVGDVKFHRKVWCRGVDMKADDMAAQIPTASRTRVRGGNRTLGYFPKTIWLPDVTPAVRLVSLWEHWNGKKPVKRLVAKPTHGEVTRILRSDRGRWTGTETLHRDGKQHLGLGDGQLRSGEGQTRHTSLVLLVHSLLVAQLHQGRVRAWAQATLTTIDEAGRTVLRETLGKTITWAIERATRDQWQPESIKAHLQLV